jgi:hypothetical protein
MTNPDQKVLKGNLILTTKRDNVLDYWKKI